MKIRFLIFLFFVPLVAGAQSIDEAFNDGGASNRRNIICFYVSDFVRGVPSFSYERKIFKRSRPAAYSFLRLDIGFQGFNPLMKIPFYANKIKFNGINYDDLTNEYFWGLTFGFKVADYFFATDNYYSWTLGYRNDNFTVNDGPVKIDNIIGGLSYYFNFDRIFAGIGLNWGMGLVNYRSDLSVVFSYKLDLSLGYSF